MAASFIGLPVSLQLRSGGTAQGIVGAVDGAAGTIQLVDAQIITAEGSRLEHQRVFERGEVAGLQLLATQKANPAPPPVKTRPPPPKVVQQRPLPAPAQRELTPWHDDAELEPSPNHRGARHPTVVQVYAPSPVPTPSPHSSPKPSSRSASKRGGRGGARRIKAVWDDVEGGDESDSYVPDSRRRQHQQVPGEAFDEDFDFSAGLRSFDKNAVFARIQSQDQVDPSLRLVAHNRNPARTSQSKLLPTESVLTVEELEAQQLDRQTAMASMPPVRGGMSVEELEGGVERMGLRRSSSSRIDLLASGLQTETGVPVPTVKLRQWKEALSIADIETSPSPFQRLELSAYQLTTFILAHLAQQFSLFPIPSPPQVRPSVLLLCTDCEKSNVAIRAGILLAHRGCRVVALVEDGRTEEVKTNLRVLSSAGGRIVRDLADLPPTFNLVIDALSETETSIASSLSSSLSGPVPTSPSIGPRSSFTPSVFALEASKWANALDGGAIVVSLDLPFGIDHDTGNALTPAALRPTFVLSRALPRPGCVALLSSTSATSPQLFVADVGFAPAIWDRIGVEGFETNVFGAEGIVRVSSSTS